MKVTHRLTVKSTCPVDNSEDTYEVAVQVDRTLPVEQILEEVKRLTEVSIYQEHFTRRLALMLNAHVTTVGEHSGVTTTVEAGPSPL